MNKQGTKNNPFGGIEWTHIFGPLSGYTANPVSGCMHDCKWLMPDGEIAICYAKQLSERMGISFESISWRKHVLDEIRAKKQPCGIFIDSMSDLFGKFVDRWMIDAVIQCIRDCPQHVFFSLTKNPSRFREFGFRDEVPDWPMNWLVGISPPPTFMFGKRLTSSQQITWFAKGMHSLACSPAQRRWVSLEPLTVDVRAEIAAYASELHWIIIGAASNGAKKHQPDEHLFRETLEETDGLPVFFKGNIDLDLAERCGGWRKEFPDLDLFRRDEKMLL